MTGSIWTEQSHAALSEHLHVQVKHIWIEQVHANKQTTTRTLGWEWVRCWVDGLPNLKLLIELLLEYLIGQT